MRVTIDAGNTTAGGVGRRRPPNRPHARSGGTAVRLQWHLGAGLALMALGLSACTGLTLPAPTPAPTPAPAVVAPPPPPKNVEMLEALADLGALKDELKRLRNAVEEVQFDTENARRRQRDAFADLDRRLLDIERNQKVIIALFGQPGQPQGSGRLAEVPVTAAPAPAPAAGQPPASPAGAAPTAPTTLQPTEPAADNGIQQPSVNSVSAEEQQQYETAFELLKQSRYEDAIARFEALVTVWPDSSLADDAYYWMSEAHYFNRKFEAALQGFGTVVMDYPDSSRVPEALLKMGYIKYDIGAYQEAAEIFRDILARFPGHKVVVSAQTRLHRIEQTIE